MGHVSTRTDFAAPHWLRQLLRSKPVPVPWNMVARAVIALSVPLGVAYALGDIGIGALISTGALPPVLSESAGPYRYRAKRLGGATAAAGVGYLVGLLTGGQPALAIPAVMLVAAVSALISAAGSNASVAGLQMFVFCVLGTGQHVTGVRVEISLGCFVIGALWSLIVALASWTVRATSPERGAVSHVYVEIAAMLSTTDEPTSRVARHQLTTAMSTAYDRLLTARSWLSGRDAAYRELLNLLSASTSAVEAAVAMVNAGRRAPDEVIEYLTGAAASVLANHPLPPAPTPPDNVEEQPVLAALYAGLERIGKGDDRQRRKPVPLWERLRAWAKSLVSGPLTWFAALRLVLCVGLAEVVGLLLPLERSYWITLTVGIVLKPDFGSVFGRAVLRGIGTVIGVAIGAAVLGVGTHGWVLVALIAVFAGGVAVGKVRNYGILSAFVTPLIILQMELANNGHWSVVLARLVDTVIGSAIVLVFGYLLWPGSRRPQVGGRLADGLATVAKYVERALAPPSDEDKLERSRARRKAYRALADLRTAFQQAVVEPSANGRQAIAWWPVIAGLERVADAVTEVVVTVEHGAPPPGPADVALLTAALGELEASIREQREPESVPMPDNPRLAGVVDQVSAAFDAVRGPDLADRPPSGPLRRFLPLHKRA
jgi:uncharacterized membrane protein YccC